MAGTLLLLRIRECAPPESHATAPAAPAAVAACQPSIAAIVPPVTPRSPLSARAWFLVPFVCACVRSSAVVHHGYLPQLSEGGDAATAALLEHTHGGRLRLGSTEVWPRPLHTVWVSRFRSAKELCHAATCSMRTWPILRLPGRLGGALVWDGVFACRLPLHAVARPEGTEGGSAPFSGGVIRVAVVPTSRATVAPAELLGGASDLVSLPSREAFDAMVRQGRSDAQLADQCGAFAALATPVARPTAGDAKPRARRSPSRQRSPAAARQRPRTGRA